MRELRDLIKDAIDKIELLLDNFWDWFKREISPELKQFLSDNKELAIKVVKEVAVDLADEIGEVKFEEALKRLADALVKETPNLQPHTSWLRFLIEAAVIVLKQRGEI